jgi:hypothetical protein
LQTLYKRKVLWGWVGFDSKLDAVASMQLQVTDNFKLGYEKLIGENNYALAA